VMKASVATVLPRLLLKREVHLDRIVVILDEKTLQDEERHLFRTQLENMAQPIVEVILGARDVFPEHAVRLEAMAAAMPRGAGAISVAWTDEVSGTQYGGAMAVADSLASNLYQEIRKIDSRPGMSQALRAAGYEHFLTDATDVVVGPLNPQTVDRWERLTGLRAPK